ncbi:aldehyde dehydrogenase family protein [Brevibacterium album]|uniref:aldehyde dehydrogenase family protein n=1 Tax=Brevibacterium album TaxID=417948 RepID=UPI0003FB9A49|nr:aldehyde dehydrogenase family protein [Brevibacterium album]
MTLAHAEARTGSHGADAVVRAAHAAFLAARTRTREERAAWMEAVADALESHREELVPLAMEETHLPEARLNGELTRSAFQLRLLAGEARRGEFLGAVVDHADPDWGMGPRPDLRRMNVPLGVVGVFGASNFPFAFSVIGGDSASALAAGCAVVHKLHGAHARLAARTAEIVVRALAEAGAPEGLFGAVSGREAAEALVDHPLVKAVGFTGSEAGGRALFDRAVARPEPIPFYGELGSLNPVVVTEAACAARAEEILTGWIGSMTMGVGQFCTKPGLLLLPEAGAEAAARVLPGAASAAALGTGMLTESIRDGFVANRDAVAASADVSVLVAGDAANPPAPGVLTVRAADLDEDAAAVRTEMFGPAAVLITYADTAELDRVLGLLGGQLTGTIHSEDGEDVSGVLQLLQDRCGRVLRGGWPTGVTVSYAQQHGGPYPAATQHATSVGTAAIDRWLRPVAFQDMEDGMLPPELQEANPLGIARRVDGEWQAAR